MGENRPDQPVLSGRDQLPEAAVEMRVRDAGFLAIFRAYAGWLGLVDIVDGPAPAETKVSAGHLALAMVYDTPGGRSPLYHLSESFAGGDVEPLLGAGIRSEDPSDDAAGRTPDRVFDAGTSKVFSPVARRAVEEFEIRERVLHFDTTRVGARGRAGPREADGGAPGGRVPGARAGGRAVRGRLPGGRGAFQLQREPRAEEPREEVGKREESPAGEVLARAREGVRPPGGRRGRGAEVAGE